MDKIKSFFEFLKIIIGDKFKKYIIQKFFNGALGGIKGFIVNIFLKKFVKNILNPLIDYIKRKYRKIVTTIKNKQKIKDIKGAKDEDTLADEFRDLP